MIQAELFFKIFFKINRQTNRPLGNLGFIVGPYSELKPIRSFNMLVPNNGSELFNFFYNNDIYVVSSCQIALNGLCFLTLEFKHIYFLRRGICIVTKGRPVSIRSSVESNISPIHTFCVSSRHCQVGTYKNYRTNNFRAKQGDENRSFHAPKVYRLYF